MNISSSASAQSNLSLLADISPNHTHFFEVMYVGKIRVSHKRVPYTFIDDALPKFRAYDVQRARLLEAANNNSHNEHGPVTMVKEETNPTGSEDPDGSGPLPTESLGQPESQHNAPVSNMVSIDSNNNKENKLPSTTPQVPPKLKRGLSESGMTPENSM